MCIRDRYETKSKALAKGVDVTEDPFNVYITGIDTYGSIATVSRSDVNMIVSINPKTHQILMTGVPRDFYIPQVCQDNQLDKLTHTGIFGVDCTLKSVETVSYTHLNMAVNRLFISRQFPDVIWLKLFNKTVILFANNF